MEKSLLEKWEKIYFFAIKISNYKPWDKFNEDDRIVYMNKNESKTFFYSFLGESCSQYGIACYTDLDDYNNARKRLSESNLKNEPVFFLQNALIGLWGNREDVSKENYNLLKELGLKCRGKGGWLHFEKYETGYAPTMLDEDKAEILGDAFEQLYMALKAVYEKGVSVDFNNGETLTRWYSEEDELYYTHGMKLDLPTETDNGQLYFKDNEDFHKLKTMPASNYSIEIDMSYLNAVIKDEGRKFFPKLLLGVNSKTGVIIFEHMFAPDEQAYITVINSIDRMLASLGKPSQIFIYSDELESILKDFCNKGNIKLTFKKRLPEIDKTRKSIEQNCF